MPTYQRNRLKDVGPFICERVPLTYGNRTLLTAEWCAIIPGLKATTVGGRRRKGWTDGQCLGLEPPPPKPTELTRVTYNGEEHTLREWEFRTRISAMTIKFRITIGGWTEEQALGFEPPPVPQREAMTDLERQRRAK